jgi:hypothetical protein
MKIGILTIHHANNYGAFLQCYALQELLKSFGNEVYVIDYRPQFIEWFYSPKFRIRHLFKLLLLLKFSRIKQYIKQYRIDKVKQELFDKCRLKHLQTTFVVEKKNIPQDFDAYVIGSDQVWSCHCTGGYDPVFWGQFDRGRAKLIGFSISSIGDYKVRMTKDLVIRCFNDFDKVSFREYKIKNEFLSWTGIDCKVTLDPTLLVKRESWTNLLHDKWKERRYVVVYQVRFLKGKERNINRIAEKFAEENGCEVIDLSNAEYGVEDFVSAICFAKCVFTSSFHATVFSIIFQKKFLAFALNDGHDVRYVDLLNELHLKNHLCDIDTEYMQCCKKDDWTEVNELLEDLKKESLDYLESIK